jgi:hypothetical protein
VLAMKTYGHLRRERSIAQAQRVNFAPVTTKHGDIVSYGLSIVEGTPAGVLVAGAWFKR